MKTRVMTALAIILVVALPVAFGGWLLVAIGLYSSCCQRLLNGCMFDVILIHGRYMYTRLRLS